MADSAEIYPLGLKVAGRLVVVVGGGPVAARRTRSLVEAGAHVRLVSPDSSLAELGISGVERVPREYRTGDLDGAWLVHTATGSTGVDRQVADDAERARIFCVTAGDASVGSAWVPAVARTTLTDGAEVTVSVTAGRDPRRAQAIRDAVAAQLDAGTLPLRRHRDARSTSGPPGRVWLVGGGPGDSGLVTVRGRSVLAQADVVIVDRLGPRALLDELSPDVEVIDVGKTSGNHPVPQHEINALLIQHAQAGRDVVRLKGGDPYVLGRGGEELGACRAAGLEVEVVPGVTSAVSVPAAAGIPVTHRGVARGFSVLTGHDGFPGPREDPQRSEDASRGEGGSGDVPGGPDHTLVLLMGVSRLADTADALVTADRPADTPAAVVEDGYGPGQRVTVGTLADIAERAAAVGVRPPAVIVVGAVVRLSPAWHHQAR